AAEVDVGTASRLRERRSDPARALGIEMAIIGLGSFGAREMGYSSGVDVQFLVLDRGAGAQAGEIGIAVATQIQRILNAPAAGTNLKVNPDRRPESRAGRLARSPDARRHY